MDYDYPLYRPPSEAYSLILQFTLGCSHNACTFCTMYKTKRYREKTWPEIEALINETALEFPRTRKIFLADGNALSLPMEVLTAALELLYTKFTRLERVSIYGSPRDILNKTKDDLSLLKRQGLHLVYLGIESGSSQVLQLVKKGVNPEEIIQAGQKVRESGLQLSATLISGLGGRELWQEHAVESARVASAINPDYLAFLTLVLTEGAPLLRDVAQGKLTLLTPWEVLQEMKLFLEYLQVEDCVFRSNHASNYFNLAGVLNQEKEALQQRIAAYLANPQIKALPVDNNRRL